MSFLHNLNLPPKAAPYVVVLTGVPTLSDNGPESYNELKNKVSWWLDTFIVGPFQPAKDVIMLRRVPWRGNSIKKRRGDCVVINFNNVRAVNYVLSNFYARDASESIIPPLPLSYFYQQINPLIPRFQAQWDFPTQKSKCLTLT